MTHDEYIAEVLSKNYPADPVVPQRDDWFANENGTIENVLFYPMGTTSIIRSRRGAIRANHYHKTDSHYLHVISGRCIYLWKKIDAIEVHSIDVAGGGTFFTPPMVEHAVLFLEETILLQLADHARTKEQHEADVVRVELLSRREANAIMSHLLK